MSLRTKPAKDLAVGDRVGLLAKDGDEVIGSAVVTAVAQSRLFRAAGGCWRIDVRTDDGRVISDQHYPGDAEIVLAGHPDDN